MMSRARKAYHLLLQTAWRALALLFVLSFLYGMARAEESTPGDDTSVLFCLGGEEVEEIVYSLRTESDTTLREGEVSNEAIEALLTAKRCLRLRLGAFSEYVIHETRTAGQYVLDVGRALIYLRESQVTKMGSILLVYPSPVLEDARAVKQDKEHVPPTYGPDCKQVVTRKDTVMLIDDCRPS